MTTRIRRYVETDTGHRVPNHKSKCRHFHGHRYRFEAEIEGDIVDTPGVSEEGMVMDFSDVSHILMEHIHDVVDHAFVVYSGDEEARTALSHLDSDHRTFVVPFIPTAENLAKWAFDQVEPHIKNSYGTSLRLVETRCDACTRDPEKLGHVDAIVTLLHGLLSVFLMHAIRHYLKQKLGQLQNPRVHRSFD